MKKTTYLLILLIILTGCSNKPLSFHEELNQLLAADAPYYKEICKGGYLIKVNYLPMRYFELRNLVALSDSSTTEEQQAAIDKAHQYYSNGVYFMVTIGFEDESKDILYDQAAHFNEWSAKLQKYLFQMGEYIYLETAQHDEIPLSLYHFERSFGYTKNRKMLLSFPLEFNKMEIISTESEYLKMYIKEFGLGIGNQSVEWNIINLK